MRRGKLIDFVIVFGIILIASCVLITQYVVKPKVTYSMGTFELINITENRVSGYWYVTLVPTGEEYRIVLRDNIKIDNKVVRVEAENIIVRFNLRDVWLHSNVKQGIVPFNRRGGIGDNTMYGWKFYETDGDWYVHVPVDIIFRSPSIGQRTVSLVFGSTDNDLRIGENYIEPVTKIQITNGGASPNYVISNIGQYVLFLDDMGAIRIVKRDTLMSYINRLTQNLDWLDVDMKITNCIIFDDWGDTYSYPGLGKGDLRDGWTEKRFVNSDTGFFVEDGGTYFEILDRTYPGTPTNGILAFYWSDSKGKVGTADTGGYLTFLVTEKRGLSIDSVYIVSSPEVNGYLGLPTTIFPAGGSFQWKVSEAGYGAFGGRQPVSGIISFLFYSTISSHAEFLIRSGLSSIKSNESPAGYYWNTEQYSMNLWTAKPPGGLINLPSGTSEGIIFYSTTSLRAVLKTTQGGMSPVLPIIQLRIPSELVKTVLIVESDATPKIVDKPQSVVIEGGKRFEITLTVKNVGQTSGKFIGYIKNAEGMSLASSPEAIILPGETKQLTFVLNVDDVETTTTRNIILGVRAIETGRYDEATIEATINPGTPGGGGVGEFGNVYIKVVDEKGNPLEGVIVYIGNWFAETDADGRGVILNIPAGTYKVKASKEGYKEYEGTFTVWGGTNTLNIVLEKPSVLGMLKKYILYLIAIAIVITAIAITVARRRKIL